MTEDVQTDALDSPVEAKAREMGWRPKEEWSGDEDRWMPAEEFVERNERLQKKADTISQKEIGRLNAQVSELKTVIDDLGQHIKKADQRAMQRAWQELQKRQRAAVLEGDTKAFDDAQRDLQALSKEAQEAQAGGEAKPAKPDKAEGDDVHPDFPAWRQENDWYGTDYVATADADNVANVIMRQTGLTGRALFDAVTAEVKKRHPHLDEGGGETRRRAPAVEGATRGGGGAKTKWDEVPREARETFKRFVKQGLYEDTKEGREKYADVYLNG